MSPSRKTPKQKSLARAIVENAKLDNPLNGGELLDKVGYSKGLQKYPKRVIMAKGVQDELKVLGFDEVSAKQVVAEIMLNKKVKPEVRLKATDQTFKVTGAYAPEVHKNVNINIELTEEERQRMDRLFGTNLSKQNGQPATT